MQWAHNDWLAFPANVVSTEGPANNIVMAPGGVHTRVAGTPCACHWCITMVVFQPPQPQHYWGQWASLAKFTTELCPLCLYSSFGTAADMGGAVIASLACVHPAAVVRSKAADISRASLNLWCEWLDSHVA